MKIIILCTLILCLSTCVYNFKLKKTFDFNFGKFANNLSNGSKLKFLIKNRRPKTFDKSFGIRRTKIPTY